MNNSTILQDRELWFDGESSFTETSLFSQFAGIESFDTIHVTEITDEITKYNALVPNDQQLTIKTSCNSINTKWNLPDNYNSLDVNQHIIDAFIVYAKKHTLSNAEFDAGSLRVASELALYSKIGLMNLLRTMIYVVDILHERNIVWGIGRGSSVSSYVLYIIGVHDVDSIFYDLDVHDFLRI